MARADITIHLVGLDDETRRILRELSAETGKNEDDLLAGAVRMLGMVFGLRARTQMVDVVRVGPVEMDG